MKLPDILSKKVDQRLSFGIVLVVVAVIAIATYWLFFGHRKKTPVYEWQCSKCQHLFKRPVANAAADRPVIECPECGAFSAERIMHFQCRMCWEKFDLPGWKATRFYLACPACGSTIVRDLDNPIPGDDKPAQGGKPNPENDK
jgi:putative FmdB family regulatory protein